MPDGRFSIMELVIFGSFAGLGGILSYLMRTLNRNETPKLSKTVVEGLSSAFVGVLAMLICKAFNLDWVWCGVIVGVFGWVGAEASIALLSALIRKRLGVTTDDLTKGS